MKTFRSLQHHRYNHMSSVGTSYTFSHMAGSAYSHAPTEGLLNEFHILLIPPKRILFVGLLLIPSLL